jgi:hypothetical protein
VIGEERACWRGVPQTPLRDARASWAMGLLQLGNKECASQRIAACAVYCVEPNASLAVFRDAQMCIQHEHGRWVQ